MKMNRAYVPERRSLTRVLTLDKELNLKRSNVSFLDTVCQELTCHSYSKPVSQIIILKEKSLFRIIKGYSSINTVFPRIVSSLE